MTATRIEHFYRDIPGWAAFEDLYVEVVRNARSTGTFVEVGSWLGRSAALMATEIANSGKQIDFFCVDPWLDGGPDLRETDYYKSLGVQDVYALFVSNVAPISSYLRALRMSSVEASKLFDDASVDFLMLDGDHSYEAVRDDLEAWLPKMKPGGIISGDDYLWPGVKQAVTEALGEVEHRVRTPPKKGNHLLSAAYWWRKL